MPYCNQRCIEEEAKQYYINKMDDYYKDCYNTMIFDGEFTFRFVYMLTRFEFKEFLS